MAFLSGFQPEHHDRRSRLRGAVVVLAGALVLSACGSDSGTDVPENRQFANEPAPTRQATETPGQSPTEAVYVGQSEHAIATPADLLRTRGAPSSLYTVSAGRLAVLQFGEVGVDLRPIGLPEGVTILGVAASPTGDRVGVLMQADDGVTTTVQFYDRDGEVLGESYALGMTATTAASPAATPMASPAAISAIPESDEPVSGTSITWIPQGNGVLVVRDNTLYSFDIENGMRVIPTDQIDGTMMHAAASPMGGQILVQVAPGDGSQTVYRLQGDTGQADEIAALRTAAGEGISELTWIPAGNGVVFVRGEIADGQVMRGEMFSFLFRNDAPKLLATSGQGGPSATITNVAISPDGSSVAYDVSIRDGNTWALHSMWVRSLKQTGAGIEVPAESGAMVWDLRWSREGLTWTSEPRYSDGGRTLYLMTPTGEVLDITPSETAPATPGASPAAAPGATPVASPVASPQATPVASPESLID